MIKPMLAVPQAKGDIKRWDDWAIEPKYDGHRLVVQVGATVTAWTRPRKHAADPSGKTMVTRDLPPHLVRALSALDAGVYDGELLTGLEDGTSTDVTRTDLAHTLRFVVFDVLKHGEMLQVERTYDERRRLLERIFGDKRRAFLTLSESVNLNDEDDVTAFVSRIWSAGGEGAIVKRRAAPYQPGKRSPDFVKIKRMQHAVLTVVGFEPTRGTVMNRGPFASLILRDEDGNETSCKTLDDFELNRLNRQWEEVTVGNKERWTPDVLQDVSKHPAIGRRLVINFPMRTRTGGYQGPVMWDRWEDE